MNPAAVILGIAGAIVTTIAMGGRSDSGGSFRAFAPAAAPPEPEPRQLPAPRTAIDSIPSHAVEVVTETPVTAIPVTSPAPGRTPPQAARELLSYVSPLARGGNTAELGTKDKPNETIRGLQTEMRGLKADGVYGPKTQARGKELLGVEFPARAGGKKIVPKQAPPPSAAKPSAAAAAAPAPSLPPAIAELKPAPAPPPIDVPVAEHSPKEAAEALWLYLQQPNANKGHKGAPSEIVRDAQKDMGGGLKPDGIYGPKTATRAKQLTGKAFPQAK